MPSSVSEESETVPETALDLTRRGMRLHAQGRSADALAAFRSAAALEPERSELRVNLAASLARAGDDEGALTQYAHAVECDPRFAPALTGLGAVLMKLGRFDEARSAYERALIVDDRNLQAHLAMVDLEQIAQRIPQALEHQRRVLERQTLFTERAPDERRRLLVLLAPGDWQANVPIDFLIDRATTTVHKLYLVDPQQAAAASIPQADAVFMAIAESDENAEVLHLANAVLRTIGLPYLNDPRKVLAMDRVSQARAFARVEGCVAPAVDRVSRATLASQADSFAYPLVVRPVGSHAGRGLERISSAQELRAYIPRTEATSFYAAPFVDFSLGDKYYRKYRIVFVDGTPYPYHLAVSPEWMIHYYNAPMREHAWMREEERRFLDEFESVFGPPLQSALREIAAIAGLEYFGIDCSIDREGRLVIFEADAAMLVHAGDDPSLFAYKRPAFARIADAFNRMIDRAGSR